MAILESLADELDRQGVIDPYRVGLVGWSRSGYLVRYTLTHSARPWAAAVIADGYDDGCFYYLSRITLGQGEAHELEGMVGRLRSVRASKPGLSAQPAPILIGCRRRCGCWASHPAHCFITGNGCRAQAFG